MNNFYNTKRSCINCISQFNLILIAGALLMLNAVGFCQAPDTLLPSTDGVVNSIVNDGNTIYLGGRFNYVGTYSGGGVLLNNSSGAEISGFPKVGGRVHTVIPDGSGGWFIGGQFSTVGGFALNDLAHINANLSVDAAWNPDVQEIGDHYVTTEGAGVFALKISGGILYVGGDFNTVGGQTRYNLAAVNLSTGTVTSWNPDVEGSLPAVVYTIAITNNVIYIGGSFSSINGQARWNAGSVYTSSGNVTYWDPDGGTHAFNGPIYSMVIVGSLIYLGGNFQNPSPLNRYYLAAFDTTQDTGVNTLVNWNPLPDSTVRTMVVSGSTIYVGGDFTHINGVTRNHFAAITTSGTLSGLNPGADGEVNDIAVSTSGYIYVIGNFTSIGGQPRNGIAVIDGSGDATGWDPQAPPLMVNDSTKNPIEYDRFNKYQWIVETIGSSGSDVYVGGNFQIWNGEIRNHLAAIDAATGVVTSWNPDADSSVTTLALNGSTIYAGGDFTHINGLTRDHVAAIDKSTGNVTSWNPGADSTVNSFAFDGSIIYVGGSFTSIRSFSRTGLAAVDSISGNVTGWNPDLSYLPYSSSGNVNALLISPDGTGNPILYVGGTFNNVNNSTRNNIAAFNLTTGNLTGWNPDADTTVKTLAVKDTVVYAGGYFTSIGGGIGNNPLIAGIGKSTGKQIWDPLEIGWQPHTSYVSSIAIYGSIVYAGGGPFVEFGSGFSDFNLGALNLSDGSTLSWYPNPISNWGSPPSSISLDTTQKMIYVAEPYNIQDEDKNFEGYALPNVTPLPVELTSFSAIINENKVELKWKTATEVNDYGFEVERASSRQGGPSPRQGWMKIGFVKGSDNSNSSKQYSFVDSNPGNGKVEYRLKQINNDGTFKYSKTIEVNLSAPTKFTLYQNYPNPFNPTTTIRYEIPKAAHVTLNVYDILGNVVETLVNKEQQPGRYSVQLSEGSHQLSSGVYFYQIKAGSFVQTKKMILLK